jgi:hypothetical protein
MFGNYNTRTFVGLVILGFVFSFLLIAWSCKTPEHIYNPEAESEELKCEFPDPPEWPKGDELRISAERLDANQLLVRIKNVSKRKVYLPYSPAQRETVFVSYLTEKRNKQGDFEMQPSESDFAPGLHSLDQGSEIKLRFFEVKKGEYRLILRYMIDGHLANLLNIPECLTKFAKEKRPAEFASGRAISPVLKITRRIPTPIR